MNQENNEDPKIERLILKHTLMQTLRKSENEAILSAIKRFVQDDIKLKELVNKNIKNYGIPDHLKGYEYLSSAIVIYMQTQTHLHTKEIYKIVAKKYNVTYMKVERAIRYAIEVKWKIRKEKVYSPYFGYIGTVELRKPTNSECIAMLAGRVKDDIAFRAKAKYL